MKCLSWDNECKSKKQAGLGAKKLRDHNMALLGKWSGKALNEPDSNWVKILRARMFKRKLERLAGRPITGA